MVTAGRARGWHGAVRDGHPQYAASKLPVDPRFGPRLRELRRQRGLSLRDLAAAVYPGKSHVHDFETGRRVPDAKHAARLDAALGAAGSLAAMVEVSGPLAYGLEHPERVDAAAVTDLSSRLAAARLLEDEVGAAPVLPAAIAVLTTIGELARHSRAPVRPALVGVGAQWAQFAGWLHLATCRQVRAGVEPGGQGGEQHLDLARTYLALNGQRLDRN